MANFEVHYIFNEGYPEGGAFTEESGTAYDANELYTAIHHKNILETCKLSGTATEYLDSMFEECRRLESVDLSELDTSNVTSMSRIFRFCERLESVNLANLDTSNATDMSGMFMGCSRLTKLDLSSFDTSNVLDMVHMFNGCEQLKYIFVSDTFVTDQVGSSGSMFAGCYQLPNYNPIEDNKESAYVGEGGYLSKFVSYSVQQYTYKDNILWKVYPKVKVDGTTIIDNNGVLSAVTSGGSDITLVVKGVI